jgi:Glycosyltransferase family 87
MMPAATLTNPRRAVLTALLAVCGTFNIVVLGFILFRHPFINADFLGFWAYPRFSPLTAIYNPDAMMRFQQDLYPGYKSFYPYTYPPDFLLFCGWLRGFSYNAARDIWLLSGLVVFAAAGWALLRKLMAVLALLASPAALLCIVLGQSSFFIGALLLGGLAALPRRPILAGVMFGLLTLKPQMGLLLPLLLLARGEWRTIFAACLTAALLVLLSYLAMPPALWPLWLSSLPQIQQDYFNGGANLNIMITPAANLVALGMAPHLAWLVQLICGLGAAGLVVWLARRAPYHYAVAALLVGMFLAQPHAYAYDSVLVPAAMALCYSPRLPGWVIALGVLVYLLPLLLLTAFSHWFLYAAPLLALFGTIIWLASSAQAGAKAKHEPIHTAI